MRHVRTRRVGIVAAFLTISIVAAACVPPPPPEAETWSFKADQVTAVVGNDPFIKPPLIGCSSEGILSNCYDEPYTINIWFRVKLGVPGSAQTGVVSTRSNSASVCAQNRSSCEGRPTTQLLNDAQGGRVNFNNLQRYDVLDVLANQNAPIEIIGSWVWAMEEDLAGTLNAGPIANILRDVLNDTIGSGQIPSDLGDLVQLIIDNLGQALLLGGAALLNAVTSILFNLGDDVLGSRFYIGLGVKGDLANIVNAVVPDLGGFNTNLAFLGIPNVLGLNIRGLGGTSQAFNNQVFNQDGRHDYNFRFFQN
jgi:hypothetical protein